MLETIFPSPACHGGFSRPLPVSLPCWLSPGQRRDRRGSGLGETSVCAMQRVTRGQLVQLHVG